MKQPIDTRRLIWLGALGGALLLGILLVSLFAPRDEAGFEPGPAVSVGATASADEQADTGTRPFSLGSGDMVSLAWRLALVIVIMAASIAALRWWARRASGPRSGTGFLRVVDTLAVGNGRTIHLVAIGRRVIVVGATQQNIAYLNELTPDETASVMAEAERPADQAVADIAANLVAAFRGGASASTRRRDVSLERLQ